MLVMDIMRHTLGTKKGSKKRFWSDDEKRSICLQTKAPGVSVAQVAQDAQVAQVARRSSMNANLIHNWLRDPRFAPDDASENEASDFLPVEIEGAVSAPGHQIAALAPDMPLSAQRVDITLSDGRRILVVLGYPGFTLRL